MKQKTSLIRSSKLNILFTVRNELFNSFTETNEEEFLEWTKFFRETAEKKDLRYCYRHNFIAQNNPENYLNIPNYCGPTPSEEEFLQEVPFTSAQKRKDFVEAVIAGGGQIRTTQQWGRLKLESQNWSDDPIGQEKVIKMHAFFENLIRKHAAMIYPELMEKKDSFRLATGYSLYENGDFSEVHFDGINPGRACVIILYFADPNTWKEGDGGELFLGHNLVRNDKGIHEFLHPYERCLPVYGNYAIMDFTKYNVGHSINLVNNNFKRFAMQSFVGP